MKQETLAQFFDPKHWDYFAEFCEYETAVGGPDPHMKLVGHMSKDVSYDERLWRGGCYVNTYNVPTAEAVWRDWPWPRVLDEDIADWLITNWDGITTRRERKSVRQSKNMAQFFDDYAVWMSDIIEGNKPYVDSTYKDAKSRYEEAWEDSQRCVKFLGRYSGFKLLEYCTQYCDFPIELPDIRPEGGWSPRSALALLFPERIDSLMGDDAPANLDNANNSAFEAQQLLKSKYGVDLTLYEVQVLLCDYKQSYVGKRQFPGRSQDSEIEYYDKIAPYWNVGTEMFDVRAAIFPHEALGEIQGWRRVRKELGTVLRDYNYTWSDVLYDYMATTDLASPVMR